ncbi:MAG: 2'-5' RNA ligase family protein [Haloarculaceae archaeon]
MARLAGTLASEIPGARPRERDKHTLVIKRLGGRDDHLVSSVREAIAGTEPFEAAVTGLDLFAEPTTGAGPVIYLAVQSPALTALHSQLCDTFPPVPGIEGDAYVPHITIARGGDLETARRLADRSIDPHRFEIETLVVWDAHRDTTAARFSLPR